jgi:hypothetical protein
MNLTKLPIFQFADSTLMQLQTKWAQILNTTVASVNFLNTKAPTQQNLHNSGIYNTPANVFYINIRMSTTSGTTSFGTSYLSVSGTAATIPASLNATSFYFSANNYLDVIISNPNPNYAFSVGSGGYIVVREYYQ